MLLTAQQNTLRQLSQDMCESAFESTGAQPQYPRCDSSDCLVCQGQRTFCSQAVTDHVCSWLERRMSASNADTASAASPPSDDTAMPEQQQHKRLKRTASDGSSDRPLMALAADGCGVSRPGSHTQHAVSCSMLSLSGASSWTWREEFADRQQPAPCSMLEVATLQSPAEFGAGQHSSCRCDMITGLEFSSDGQLLAAAGVSKQVALYPLAALHEQQQQQTDWMDSSSSPQAQQQEQRGSSVPSLPPVALVRLPGKVSSIAWSPDMDGVISIGDYDGTLTQVHVASGHYLNEVDAHGGRRIWSVAHSRLRPHLAATASDDCTAKLWAGHGFSASVATIRLPGSPAVCGVDFSSSESSLLALAAADSRVYLYDLRRLAEPLVTLHGHRRPVSYAKFFGPGQLVSASIDGTLAIWDLGAVLGLGSGRGASGVSGHSTSSSTCHSSDASWQQQQGPGMYGSQASTAAGSSNSSQIPSSQQQQHYPSSSSGSNAAGQLKPWKVFQGHTNEKNFVGLSVQPAAGLMAVGSESNDVFTYHTSWSDPLARFGMAQTSRQQQQEDVQQQLAQPATVAWTQQQQQQQQQRSVCAVAWQPAVGGCNGSAAAGCCAAAALLAAATSAGECKLLALVQP